MTCELGRAPDVELCMLDFFNAMFPIGSTVIHVDDSGKGTEVITRSLAWILENKFAVFEVEGSDEYFLVSRVRIPPGWKSGASA